MEHVFSVWQQLVERITTADQILLLTDFDGTLSPIAGRPEEAVLPDGTKRALQALLGHDRVRVAVISGRALSDIKNKVGIQGITYAGNHGMEMEGPCLEFVYPPAEAMKPAHENPVLDLEPGVGWFRRSTGRRQGVNSQCSLSPG